MWRQHHARDTGRLSDLVTGDDRLLGVQVARPAERSAVVGHIAAVWEQAALEDVVGVLPRLTAVGFVQVDRRSGVEGTPDRFVQQVGGRLELRELEHVT